jgi:UDP-N-acetylglucosamine---dolichyl-phosphate N-acetylglucosaminyltransferase
MNRIGIILPAFNEAGVIKSVIESIPTTLLVNKTSYTLVPVVVNDGSKDDTEAVALSTKRAVVISHVINMGAGAATRTGLRYLRENDFTYGATMDSDGQHSPKDLQKAIVAVINNAGDFVIGSRLIGGGNMPWYKTLGNKGLNFLTHLLLGVSSTDSQSGLKSFNRTTIDRLYFRENGYAFCSEILWRAHKANLRIAEVPIEAIYTDYSKMKGQNSWNAFPIVKQLFKHRFFSFFYE